MLPACTNASEPGQPTTATKNKFLALSALQAIQLPESKVDSNPFLGIRRCVGCVPTRHQRHGGTPAVEMFLTWEGCPREPH